MKRWLKKVSAQTFILLLLSCAKDATTVAPKAAAPTLPPAEPGAFVSSTDAATGRPTFLWATSGKAAPSGASVVEAARYHLRRLAPMYGVSAAVADATELVFVHDLGRGAKLVALRQRVGGVEIDQGSLKVLMKPDLTLVAVSGTLRRESLARGGFVRSAADALATALSTHFATSVTARDLASRGRAEGGYERLALTTAPAAQGGVLRLDEPARVKPVYFDDAGVLVPAYFLEFFAATDKGVSSDAYRYVISAIDGKVLERVNLTADAAFSYRVWAEPTGTHRPLDGPLTDVTPHPTGSPDGVNPTFTLPSLVSADGFNTNPSGTSDPWLATGATQTLGNNVDAYSDVNSPDGYSNGDLRATTTAAGVFDRLYDTLLAPVASPDQQMAAITQLFFTTNWLHDYWYDSGFDEASGNAQQSNFGRGGLGGDPLHVEAQDGSGRNNANMSTPSDGASPRMQMYVWSGRETRTLVLSPSGQSLTNSSAAFGPQAFNVTGTLIVANSQATAGGAPIGDGCTPIVNNVAGQIAVIDRGTCAFVVKVKNAQNAGAIGVVVVNNVAGVFGALGGADATITIPALGVTLDDGTALKTSLSAGAVTATMNRVVGTDLDGDLDATVVSHEWGHYLHHRLATCSSAQQCAAMSEGWADFTALQMLLREGDNLDGSFAVGVYAEMSTNNFSYFGIRRFPYSVDFSKNALTFKHIANGVTLPGGGAGTNNSEVHNGGEIWAETMFEAYVALQKQTLGPVATRTFAQTQRLMADYVVAGLELTPPEATYTEQRDALLAAISASSAEDLATVAAAFARRGLGSCAIAPPRTSTTFVGATESFELKTNLAITKVTLDDSGLACDTDGVLDVGETGKVTVQLTNGSAIASAGADVSLGNAAAGVVFPAGATQHVAAIPAFGSATVSFDVALDASVTGVQAITFDVTAADANACQTTVSFAEVARGNTDVGFATSASDDVEADVSAWSESDGHAFGRVADDPMHHHWNGADLDVAGDVKLTSPSLAVSATQPLVVTFKHRYAFEADLSAPATPKFYDGGVIEVSVDDGATWQDVSTFVAPGYGGPLAAGSSNVLAGRQAFVNKNAASPAYDTVTLDFGTQLAGKTARLRFRVASDLNTGAAGWDIDDIAMSGLDNTPFNTVITDQPSECPAAPLAEAGADQVVASGATVGLDASGSSDVNGDTLTYAWTQTAGPHVTLAGAGNVATVFHAPVVAVPTLLTFEVKVSDASFHATDSVDVTVLPPPAPDAGVPDAGAPDASVPDAAVPDAAVPDAAVPDADVPDADVPDAEVPPPQPDAAPGTPDAAPATPDAAPGAPDAAPVVHPDAGLAHTEPGGCGCEVGRADRRGAPAGSALTMLGLAALVPALRRRRRK